MRAALREGWGFPAHWSLPQEAPPSLLLINAKLPQPCWTVTGKLVLSGGGDGPGLSV